MLVHSSFHSQNKRKTVLVAGPKWRCKIRELRARTIRFLKNDYTNRTEILFYIIETEFHDKSLMFTQIAEFGATALLQCCTRNEMALQITLRLTDSNVATTLKCTHSSQEACPHNVTESQRWCADNQTPDKQPQFRVLIPCPTLQARCYNDAVDTCLQQTIRFLSGRRNFLHPLNFVLTGWNIAPIGSL